jgi:hypothetical protein
MLLRERTKFDMLVARLTIQAFDLSIHFPYAHLIDIVLLFEYAFQWDSPKQLRQFLPPSCIYHWHCHCDRAHFPMRCPWASFAICVTYVHMLAPLFSQPATRLASESTSESGRRTNATFGEDWSTPTCQREAFRCYALNLAQRRCEWMLLPSSDCLVIHSAAVLRL